MVHTPGFGVAGTGQSGELHTARRLTLRTVMVQASPGLSRAFTVGGRLLHTIVKNLR